MWVPIPALSFPAQPFPLLTIPIRMALPVFLLQSQSGPPESPLQLSVPPLINTKQHSAIWRKRSLFFSQANMPGQFAIWLSSGKKKFSRFFPPKFRVFFAWRWPEWEKTWLINQMSIVNNAVYENTDTQ